MLDFIHIHYFDISMYPYEKTITMTKKSCFFFFFCLLRKNVTAGNSFFFAPTENFFPLFVCFFFLSYMKKAFLPCKTTKHRLFGKMSTRFDLSMNFLQEFRQEIFRLLLNIHKIKAAVKYFHHYQPNTVNEIDSKCHN